MVKNVAVLLAMVLVSQAFSQEGKVDGFPFPGDLGGKRVESLLAPGAPVKGGGLRTTPLPRPAPRFLEAPEASRPLTLTPPRPEAPGGRLTTPLHPAEPTPLAHYAGSPTLPRPLELPAGELAYWPSLRLDQVSWLPILGKAKVDRASLKDPTVETSLAAALKKLSLARGGPAPFAPVNLPDPFELRRSVELRDPPEELGMPPVVVFPRIGGR